LKEANPPSAVFNTVLKLDTETGRYTRHDLGNQIVGEAAFVPKPGGRTEDDGYLAAFTYDPVRRGSNLVPLDARRIAPDKPRPALRRKHRARCKDVRHSPVTYAIVSMIFPIFWLDSIRRCASAAFFNGNVLSMTGARL
jgi:hypothetical protein